MYSIFIQFELNIFSKITSKQNIFYHYFFVLVGQYQKSQLLLFLLLPFIGFTQVQIGQDILGQNTNDQYGHSLGVSSDGSIIAASSNRAFGFYGSVKMFKKISNTWIQVGQNITGSGGKSIALSGDGTTVVIGGHAHTWAKGWFGAAFVFKRALTEDEILHHFQYSPKYMSPNC